DPPFDYAQSGIHRARSAREQFCSAESLPQISVRDDCSEETLLPQQRRGRLRHAPQSGKQQRISWLVREPLSGIGDAVSIHRSLQPNPASSQTAIICLKTKGLVYETSPFAIILMGTCQPRYAVVDHIGFVVGHRTGIPAEDIPFAITLRRLNFQTPICKFDQRCASRRRDVTGSSCADFRGGCAEGKFARGGAHDDPYLDTTVTAVDNNGCMSIIVDTSIREYPEQRT